MNPQLLMSNSALGNFAFGGTNPASLVFSNAASRLLSQSPKSTHSNNKRNISGASTPALIQAPSSNRSPSGSPTIADPKSHQNDEDGMIHVSRKLLFKNNKKLITFRLKAKLMMIKKASEVWKLKKMK